MIVCLFVCMYVCMYVCTNINVYMFVCALCTVYVYMYVCIVFFITLTCGMYLCRTYLICSLYGASPQSCSLRGSQAQAAMSMYVCMNEDNSVLKTFSICMYI